MSLKNSLFLGPKCAPVGGVPHIISAIIGTETINFACKLSGTAEDGNETTCFDCMCSENGRI